MCGLVGIASSTLTAQHVKIFKQSLHVDMLRGEDSTGIAVVPASLTTPIILKKALIPTALFALEECDKLLQAAVGGKVLIGHNRAATKGMITDETAHPFQVDNITLVHNGTLWQHHNLPGGSKFEVDSEAIAHSIADIGIEETVKKLDGAFALVIFDEAAGKLYIVRNEKRPLWLAFSKGQDTLLWASEKPMLELVSSRNAMQIEKYTQVKDHVLYTFDLSSKFKDFKEVKVEGRKFWESYAYGEYGYRSYGSYGHNVHKGSFTHTSRPTPLSLGYSGDDTSFIVDSITPYPGSAAGNGSLTCYTCDHNAYLVNVYGVKTDDFTTGAEYKGKICSATKRHAHPAIRLVVDASTIRPYRTVEEYNKWLDDGCPAESSKRLAVVDVYGETWVELDGSMMTEQAATKALANGCCQCGDPIPLDDAEDVMLFQADEYLCKHCTDLYICDSSVFDVKNIKATKTKRLH